MKLLIVTRETSSDRSYGLGKTLSPVLEQLESRGHSVTYYDKSATDHLHRKWQPVFERYLGFFLKGLTPAIAERLIQGISAAAKALGEGYSHVWLHDPWLALGLYIGLLRKGRIRRPFKLIISEHGLGSFAWAVTLDGLPIQSAAFRRLVRLERQLLQRADAVFVPSYVARDALLRDLGLTDVPGNLHVMGYGRPRLELPTRHAARRYFDLPLDDLAATDVSGSVPLPASPPVILASGRIAPVKAFPLLIDVIARLQQQHGLAAQLIIAGGGDSTALQHQAEALQLEYPPIIGFQEDMGWSLAAADLYISTCPVESYGQANREAIAAGLPVIAPASGGSGEVLGQGAHLLPVCDLSAETDAVARARIVNTLAAELADTLSNPDHYRYWQAKARREAGLWPDWSDLADIYEARLTGL
ncbi:glycosyltransferase family 4 protein [Oceanospirillum linum]|uniref:Glycosyltransferase subfamily 4-like N-terminal domain-containing protein n=1 Tax=Oceanospirillum linum TaxID=966 RepID=A0A1T1HAW6_OCELI|nr:glycosyltransferase family 4 protein [Oceanospirillum linum]OOV86965.1 hypothetical protein BTA35_0208045 [Oceanospirillum linum]SEF69880.1 Glycosyltransferase involved in cell wall bisynthesis [Oleiphilus messinensis]SMP15144.1 Glycosyltransferase involved in cell wall bisynthesis [Oceanospirillum linum]